MYVYICIWGKFEKKTWREEWYKGLLYNNSLKGFLKITKKIFFFKFLNSDPHDNLPLPSLLLLVIDACKMNRVFFITCKNNHFFTSFGFAKFIAVLPGFEPLPWRRRHSVARICRLFFQSTIYTMYYTLHSEKAVWRDDFSLGWMQLKSSIFLDRPVNTN